MIISVNFQLQPPYDFKEDFYLFICKFNVLVVMATNQIQLFGQNIRVI